EEAHEPVVARAHSGPSPPRGGGARPGRAPARLEEDGAGGAQPPRDRSWAVQREAVDHDMDFTCPTGVRQSTWPGTPQNNRYATPRGVGHRAGLTAGQRP